MNKTFIKTPGTLLLLALLSSVSCTDKNDPSDTEGVGVDGTVRFAIRGVPYQDSSDEATEMLSQVNVFHFKGEDFFLRTDIEDPYAESISLPTNGTTRVYCVSGTDLNPKIGMKEADFLNSTVTCSQGTEKAQMFYSGSIDFSEENLGNRRLDIEMKRGVARIDFANTVDPNILITKILVEDAPAKSFVFPCESMPDDATVTFSREFSEPFFGTETGMFQIFESTRPVNLRVIGEYGDTPINILTTIPTVERNKVYTLQITNINSNVAGAFTCKDWEEGKTTGAVPSTSRDIFIDRLNSIIPEGVEVDYGKNTVTVPIEGAKNIKLAFLAKTKVTINSVEGEISTAKISANEPVKVEEGYISSLNLSVEPNKRLAYSLLINIKDEEGRHNFVEVNVLTNSERKIETVEIAGRTWMAFNAMTSDPNVQVFPIDGMTVEEMYRDNWAMAIGSFFQYGKAMNYSPWTKNDPNGNSETPRDIPWGTPEAMPVPEGYHVATIADWQALIPNRTTLPSTYTAGNGEEIKAELITLPGTLTNSPSGSANKAGLLMRYLRFESQQTGNVLIIPICGMKTASWDEYPGGGRPLHAWTGYWLYEDRRLWLLQVGGTEDAPTVTYSADRWNYDGFMAVRGVKNLD